MQHVRVKLGCSERRTCRALGVARSTVRYIPQPREDESAHTAAMTRLACQYGRYGYRRVLKLMVVIDEFTRRCLAIPVARRIRS